MNDQLIDITAHLPRHPTLTYPTRDTRQIDTIVIHHSADEGDPWGWARFHVGTRGWAGIGYHVAIMRDGTGFKTNNDSTVSAHAGEANPRSIGIVLQGDLSRRPPDLEQLTKALYVVRRYRRAYGIERVIGHRDVMQTGCPGLDWLAGWLARGSA